MKGTFPLPEAQLDRFLLRLRMGYPSVEEELEILTRFRDVDPLHDVRAVATLAELTEARAVVRSVHVSEDVARYLTALTRATRESPLLRLGASPRASLALQHACQARAALDGRGFATPDDVQAMVAPVLGHRLLLSRKAVIEQCDAEDVLRDITESVPVPAEPAGDRAD